MSHIFTNKILWEELFFKQYLISFLFQSYTVQLGLSFQWKSKHKPFWTSWKLSSLPFSKISLDCSSTIKTWQVRIWINPVNIQLMASSISCVFSKHHFISQQRHTQYSTPFNSMAFLSQRNLLGLTLLPFFQKNKQKLSGKFKRFYLWTLSNSEITWLMGADQRIVLLFLNWT